MNCSMPSFNFPLRQLYFIKPLHFRINQNIFYSCYQFTFSGCLFDKMFSYLIIVAIAAGANAMNCGMGIPILTRIPNELGTYTVAFQCLCPIDYFGIQCKHHRKIKCYLTTKQVQPQSIDNKNFQAEKEFNITFYAQCYLQESNRKFISFINYFFNKEGKKQNYEWQLQSGKEGGEIIWANNTNLLTQNGMVKYQEGYNFTEDEFGVKHLSKSDEKKILYGNGPFKFNYKSQFLGFPMTNSQFHVTSNTYKILLNTKIQPKQSLEFINFDNYTSILRQVLRKQQETRQYYQKFSIYSIDFTKLNMEDLYTQFQEIRDQLSKLSKIDVIPEVRATIKVNISEQAQLGMLKAQFGIEQTCNEIEIYHTSVNSANVRIPIKVPGIAQATVYNSNFYKPPSRIIYLFMAIAVLVVLYLVYRLFKKRRILKRKQIQMQVQSQYEQNQLK